MTLRWTRWCLLLAACAPAAGCDSPVAAPSGSPSTSSASSASRSTTPEQVVPSLTLDCGDPIDTSARPPAGLRPVLDAVAVDTSGPKHVGQADGGRSFVKSGVLVRAGTSSRINVTRPHSGTEVGWGNRGDLRTSRQFVVPACPAPAGSAPTAWLAFPGGFHVSEPTCVQLTVSAGGRSTTVEVPAGKSCP